MGQVPSNLLIPTEEVEVLGRGRVKWGAGGKFIEWDSRSVNVQHPSVAEELLQKYSEQATNLRLAPYLLKIAGICRLSGVSLITERTEGTLAKLFQSKKERTKLTLYERLKIATHVAHALRHLHKYDIVHGDLCLDNIIWTEEGTAKLKEIGITRVEGRNGDIYHAAPELLSHLRKVPPPTKATDIYAFGMILLELTQNKAVRSLWRKDQKSHPIASGEDSNFDPAGSEDKNAFISATLKNYRPEFPNERNNTKLAALYQACCSAKAEERPTAEKVYSLLIPAILQRLMKNKNARAIWLDAVQLQAKATGGHLQEALVVEWEHFATALYVNHIGLPMPKPSQLPPSRRDKNFTHTMGLLFIRELLGEHENPGLGLLFQASGLTSLALVKSTSAPADGFLAILRPMLKKEKKKKKKKAKGVLGEKGVDVDPQVPRFVSLDKFVNFLFWFPLLRKPNDTTILTDVVSVLGHKYFQIIHGTAEANRMLVGSKTGTFLMRFSGEAGSFAVSYVLEHIEKPKPKTDIRHCRFTRLKDGRFSAVISDKAQSFVSLDEVRARLVKDAGLVLSRPYEKPSDSSMDELRAIWSMVEEPTEAVADFGYREEFSTAYGQSYVSTADDAIEAGMREARDRPVEKEKEGILLINNKERFVIVRDGVLMLWTGPGSKYDPKILPHVQGVARSAISSLTVRKVSSSQPHRPLASLSPSEREVYLQGIAEGTQPPQKVLVLDGGTISDMKEGSFRLDCNNWSGILSLADINHLSDWANTLSYWRLQGKNNRYSSFCPPHENVVAQWYVDGKDTYDAMADAIEGAKYNIFVADWFMIVQTYMRRDHPPSLSNRFDKMIQRKAAQGVRVYVLLYSEMSIALKLNSQHTERLLKDLHANIHIIRHPFLRPFSWSHHQKILVVDEETAFVGGLDICFGRWDTPEHSLVDNCHLATKWPGRDYMNSELEGLASENVEKPFSDTLDRNKQHRLPWHDIHMSVKGQGAKDVALNFIQRWNAHRDKKGVEKAARLPPLVPLIRPSESPSGTCECQVLRSIDRWSGSNRLETSILHAYLESIRMADHFIYIENQFFISSTAGGIVENQIAQAIVDRIILAHKQKETFRVIVVLPNAPEGNIFDAEVKFVMKWWYDTVSRGELSMIYQLESAGINPTDYLSFHGLRNWGILDDGPVCSQIYVHCKCMIVDDRIAIIGSANINDRSMLGSRDSEIAIITRDSHHVDIKMDGRPYTASHFAHTLRLALWREHLGLDDDSPMTTQIVDPICNASYNEIWRMRSRANTKLLSNVFSNMFSDDHHCLKDYAKSLNAKPPADYMEYLKEVKGHLVDIPLKFLCDENLSPGPKDLALKVIDANVFT